MAMNITDDKQKRAMLLYQVGTEMQEIFETFQDTGDDYATAKAKLNEYFLPKKNVDFEILQFRQAIQQAGETVEQYATRLRKLAVHCEFNDIINEVKSVIIQNCLSKRLRRFALREEELTLEKLLAKARSLEASEIQATGMEESLSHQCQVNFVRDKKPKPQQRPTTPSRTSQSLQTCRKCGQSWPHKGRPCPAQGQTCNKCGKPNHYARVCMSATRLAQNSSQQINQVVEKQSPVTVMMSMYTPLAKISLIFQKLQSRSMTLMYH